uniref:Hyaluronidase n=1 Tax=Gouania willdenowi TaxID=441366 RepID=A0A8C5HNA5_GOUWI
MLLILPHLTFLAALTVSLWPDLTIASPKPPHAASADFPTLKNSADTTSAAPTSTPIKSKDFINSQLSNFSVITLLNSVSYTSVLSKQLSFRHVSPLSSSEEQKLNKKGSLHLHHQHVPPSSLNHIWQKFPQTLKHEISSHKPSLPRLHKTHKPPLSKKSPSPLYSTQLSPFESLHTTVSSFSPSNKGLLSLSFANTSPKPLFPLPTSSPHTSAILSSLTSGGSQPTQPAHTATRIPFPPQTTHPLFDHHPFIVTWNIPDLVCNRHNIPLDTSPFRGVTTPVPGQFLSLFYTDRLGFYPHVDPKGKKQVYGGIPQKVNMKASVNKARADIKYYIPSKGLAVIDWEEWRPLWDRNWGRKRVYQTLSVSHAQQMNHSLTRQQEAARRVMSGMLSVGRTLRPNYHWGFYLFPNCYNHGWQGPGYTGECSEEVRRQNDELLWLWESSSAFYPSVYLVTSLTSTSVLFLRNRVQEALRVSALPGRNTTSPVFVYMRPVFVDQNRRFLSQRDLISTIGESAAVGASGAVLWGASADYNDKTSCEALSSYLDSTLNPYIINVTAAAQLCSNYLCRGNGRCVRKNYNSPHYLHLNPDSFRVLRVQKRFLVLGRPTLAELKTLSRSFTCQCYKGLSCTPRTYTELTKALMFKSKQESYNKPDTLTKAESDKNKQARITKDYTKKNAISRW